ncbi:MAG: methylaspartate mutase subunit E [Deltaproteobacteria bacterium]|nr:methylaspartate mutase subunit E [Deltaproteobacteria bacterium]
MPKYSVKNEKFDEDSFLNIRQEIVSKWPTLNEVDLQEAVGYHKTIPSEKNLFALIRDTKKRGETIIYPRGGVALVDDQIDLLLHLQDHGGADYLPTTVDSYTRNEFFESAKKGIEQSIQNKRSMLNGFPVVNHGVASCRKIIEAISVPAMLLPGTPSPCTPAEIAFAAGYTGLLGAGISDTLRFTKKMPLSEGIRNYQYVDRLVSYYGERGVGIHREHTGFLTGTLIPPAIAISISVLDCLLAANQGVRQYSLGIGHNVNIVQDVAALKTVPRMCARYLHRFGVKDMALPVGLHHWMGAFPPNEAEAVSVICLATVIGLLGEVTHMTTKTSHEAIGVPSRESNAFGLRATKKMIKLLSNFSYPSDPRVDEEMYWIEREAESILDRVLEMGDGDPAVGAIRGFEAGIIDVPWSPNMCVANKVLPARDSSGAIRYLDTGNLPFSKEIKEFHLSKLKERAHNEQKEVDIDLAIQDVTDIAKSVIN